MRDRYTFAQLYAGGAGLVLVLIGVIGFFVNSSFDTGSSVQGETMLGFEINGWHNLVHLASGALGLAAATRPIAARTFSLAFGAVYAVVFLWGLADDTVLWTVPVNSADDILHAVLAGAGLAAGLLTREVPSVELEPEARGATQRTF